MERLHHRFREAALLVRELGMLVGQRRHVSRTLDEACTYGCFACRHALDP
jgi:hypothetical protein